MTHEFTWSLQWWWIIIIDKCLDESFLLVVSLILLIHENGMKLQLVDPWHWFKGPIITINQLDLGSHPYKFNDALLPKFWIQSRDIYFSTKLYHIVYQLITLITIITLFLLLLNTTLRHYVKLGGSLVTTFMASKFSESIKFCVVSTYWKQIQSSSY